MIVKVVVLLCFVFGTHAKPISVPTSVQYAPAPTYSYAAAPLQTYAVPKVVAPVVSAPIVSPVYHTPVYKQLVPEPYDPNPEYSYSYGVNDPHTGDSKHAEESLYNGVVRGSYSLAEPDGTVRKVTYTADKINGFNAVVEKHGTPVYPTPTKYVAPVASVYHAPVAKYVAPVAPVYHAPVAKYVAPVTPFYHAPVAKYVAPAYHAPVYASYH